uniref:Uncharacterized protein n=1 Tax=Corethron hystrix TaxID=216773 RepID=A0A7S1BV14_9STRA|mmetsp:Transcript_40637/g.95421  ORF Transcript_40637/g.95421 Transcript_40637/m.95421 type:complete len:126 (+) Transcript_40637:394-771(+)
MAYFDALYAGEYVCEDTLKYKFGVDDATGNVVVVNAELENTKYIYALRPSQNFDTAVLLQGSNPYIYNGKQLKESNMNNINAIDPSITNANNIEWRIHNDGFLELAEYIPQDQFLDYKRIYQYPP